MLQPFGPILRALARGQTLTAEERGQLSDLPRGQVPAFLVAWAELEVEQRLAAVRNLAELEAGDIRVVLAPVFRSVLRDEAAEVRAAAMSANVFDESEAYLEALLAALRSDPAPVARRAAAEALGPFAYRAEVGELPAAAAQRLESALREVARGPGEDLSVRAAALASLGYFSGEAAQAVVLAALGEPELERAAVRALGRSADPRWIERLLTYTHRPEAGLRAEAAAALGEIEDEHAVPRLVELIDDPSAEVRVAAATALGAIGGEEAREALLHAAESADRALAEAARAALETLESLDAESWSF